MEILVFTLNAIVIYFVADFIVRVLEQRNGGALKYRQVLFFIIFLSLALVSFNFLQSILSSSAV